MKFLEYLYDVHYISIMANEFLLENIGRVVRRSRREGGLRAKDLATRAGLSLRFINQLESGQANISILKLAAVAQALSVSLVHLLGEATKKRKSVVLLGLRGAGKSTIGPLLAERVGVEFVELDSLVEERAGLGLTEIFSLHGEQYYRRMENLCLGELLGDDRPVVVALSGGVVNNVEAFERVKQECITVWLEALPQDHMDRVLAQGDFRPVVNRDDAMAELEALMELREPFYQQASIRVHTSELDVHEVVKNIQRSLEREEH